MVIFTHLDTLHIGVSMDMGIASGQTGYVLKYQLQYPDFGHNIIK